MDKELRKKVNLLKPSHFLGFGFGSGLIPLMPGTMGSLAALPLVAVCASYLPLSIYLALTAIIIVLGVWICEQTSNDLGLHDHGSIVWDEIAGMFVTFIAIQLSWHSLLLGFILFRFFDILKPWPIKWLDKHVHGGFGIMLDDIVAGLFSLICLHAGYYVFGF